MSSVKSYNSEVDSVRNQLRGCEGLDAEHVARMRLQNRFPDGLSIARHCAKVMRSDMAAYDEDPTKYTQSLGAWHGFIAQQSLLAAKKHYGTVARKYVYLSGWMVAALRSTFGPLPDQSMHEKTRVPELIEEIYSFLKQADALALRKLFAELDKARQRGEDGTAVIAKIDAFSTHVVPIIADIDAGFGNEEATYHLAKRMILAGACAIQIENQVSDAKQCGHQAGKCTVPHEDFIAKIKAVRCAFLELGVPQGVIVARTDSLGAGLTQKLPISSTPGDLASRYLGFLDGEECEPSKLANGDVAVMRDGRLIKVKRLPNGLFCFREGTGADRVVMDCIASLDNGADLLWIETPVPSVEEIGSMVARIRAAHPRAKLTYNNSPSFNWTLKMREQVYENWKSAGKDVSAYPAPDKEPKALMDLRFDATPLGVEADRRIRSFQLEAATKCGVFHHLITLPTYHTAALSTDELAAGYFGPDGMLSYVLNVQRKEIRQGLQCVKHQEMAGTHLGDDHKKYFNVQAEMALIAGGAANTMNQF